MINNVACCVGAGTCEHAVRELKCTAIMPTSDVSWALGQLLRFSLLAERKRLKPSNLTDHFAKLTRDLGKKPEICACTEDFFKSY